MKVSIFIGPADRDKLPIKDRTGHEVQCRVVDPDPKKITEKNARKFLIPVLVILLKFNKQFK